MTAPPSGSPIPDSPAPEPEPRAGAGRRVRLDRGMVLGTALHLVDQHGVEALTMRRVATELQVDPMTLYRHVKNKDALLDGIVEQLWSRVGDQNREVGDWRAALAQLAERLREVVMSHPNAASLLLARPVLPRSALEALKRVLEKVKSAGFEERHAAAIVRCVSSVALSDAALHVSYGSPQRPAGDAEVAPDQWISLTQLLPADTPADLVRVAWAICPRSEPDDDFGFALELIVAGAQQLRDDGQSFVARE